MKCVLEKAKWLQSPDAAINPPKVFRKTFTLAAPPVKAVLTATAMGIYEVHINGARVGDNLYAPGWTAYHSRLQYQEYDIAQYLKSGENVIDITAAPGWCVGSIGFEQRRRIWASRQAILAHIALTDAAGGTAEICTDKTWSVGQGPVLFTDFFDGETYDANAQPDGFVQPVYSARGYDNLIPQEGENIKMIETLDAVEIIHAPNGETLVDFGQNMSGFVEFTVDAKPGDVVEFDHAEILDKDGNFYNGNYRGALTNIKYICRDGRQSFHPRFAFQGFRYIRVKQWPGKLEDASCLKAHVVHSQLKRTGDFSCSSPLVNQLFKNIIWGQRGNFLEVPTDCPQRNERLGWTGDAQVFIRTASYNYDVEKFFRKWLKDLAASQFPDGGVPHVIPDTLTKKNTAAGWADAAVIIPWQIYLTYGDEQVLRDQFPSMRAYVEYLRAQGDEECLWNTGVHYGDWLAMDAPCPWDVPLDTVEYTGATHPYLVATAFYAYSTQLLVKAGRVLGYDMDEYEDLHSRIKAKFRETFYDGDMLISDTQTAWILGLHFDLLKDRDFGIKRLAQLVKDNGNHLSTGFLGTPYILHALSDNGCEELAYTLLLQEEFPSWLYSVKLGATTIWEHWDGKRPDGSMWSEDMNSFNHYAYGAVADWMYQTAAGIAPTEQAPGFKHIRFAPKADPRLGYCQASIDTRNGTVAGGWKYVDGKVEYWLSVPPGCTAEVVLAGETRHVSAGEHKFTK